MDRLPTVSLAAARTGDAAAMQAAMRARDAQRRDAIRLIQAEIQRFEIDQRVSADDDRILALLDRMTKQRRDSIESYDKGGRDDLAARERQELAVVNEYLPQQMSEDEVREIVAAAIAESGASSARDLGQVMKLVMPRVKGVADGALVNRVVRELLGA